jgi:hypothetical protein
MVIKETKTAKLRDWRDPQNWRNRVPREVRVHQLVEDRRRAMPEMCRYLVRFRTWRLFMKQRKYRLYLDRYEGADLGHAVTTTSDTLKHRPLPESFIWYVLKVLASSCLVLQGGTTLEEPLENWKPITHLDVRLPNIFLKLKRKKGETSEELSEDRTKRSKTVTSEATISPKDGFKEWSDSDWEVPYYLSRHTLQLLICIRIYL